MSAQQVTKDSQSRADRELLMQVQNLISDPLIDPSRATQQLISELQSRLQARADALEYRHRCFRHNLSELSKQFVAKERGRYGPVARKQGFRTDQAVTIKKSFTRLKTLLKSPDLSPAERRKVRRELDRLDDRKRELESQLSAAIKDGEASEKRTSEFISTFEPLWRGIKGAESMSLRLAWRIAAAGLQSSILRLVFLLFTFAISILIDRYTSLAETILTLVPTSERHDLAISLLFFAQALLLEPIVGRIKAFLAWRDFRKLVSASSNLLDELEYFEARCNEAESFLNAHSDAL